MQTRFAHSAYSSSIRSFTSHRGHITVIFWNTYYSISFWDVYYLWDFFFLPLPQVVWLTCSLEQWKHFQEQNDFVLLSKGYFLCVLTVSFGPEHQSGVHHANGLICLSQWRFRVADFNKPSAYRDPGNSIPFCVTLMYIKVTVVSQ